MTADINPLDGLPPDLQIGLDDDDDGEDFAPDAKGKPYLTKTKMRKRKLPKRAPKVRRGGHAGGSSR